MSSSVLKPIAFAVAVALPTVALLAGCRSGPSTDTSAAAPTREHPAVSEVAEGPAGSSSGATESDGSGAVRPPEARPEEQVCDTADDCRVFRPADWNPRVECCYEYGCGLGYIAVNTSTWAALRQWQRENPFDCTEHLATVGPCSTRSPGCGLMQDAPPPTCVDGLCAPAFPEPWPQVDGDAQRCVTQADCVAYRPRSNSTIARCCGSDCGGGWLAINRQTAREIDDWRANEAPECEPWRADNDCPGQRACNDVPPAVTCRGGACTLHDLPPHGSER